MAHVSARMSVSHHRPRRSPRQDSLGESVALTESLEGLFFFLPSFFFHRRERGGGRGSGLEGSTWKWDPFIPLPITPPIGIWHGIVLGRWARSDAICWHVLSFHKLPIPLRPPENNNRRHGRAANSPGFCKPPANLAVQPQWKITPVHRQAFYSRRMVRGIRDQLFNMK